MNDQTLSYHAFASYYDQAMGDRSDITYYLHEIVENYAPRAQSLLELAVGTGSILASFHDFSRLAGIDTSPEMLEIARQKLPQARLEQADMANFSLGEQYDLIICMFDSINHVMEFSDWKRIFSCTRQHLAPGGFFIFDMNTTGRLRKLASLPPQRHTFDSKIMQMNVTEESSNRFACHVSFYKDSKAETLLSEEVIYETSFPLDQVRTAAERYFDPVSILDQTGELATDQLNRAFFIYTAGANSLLY